MTARQRDPTGWSRTLSRETWTLPLPTTPGTGGDLQDEIDRLRALLAACEEPVETDATGVLGGILPMVQS